MEAIKIYYRRSELSVEEDEKVILIRYGEILLKGLNRSMFENKHKQH